MQSKNHWWSRGRTWLAMALTVGSLAGCAGGMNTSQSAQDGEMRSGVTAYGVIDANVSHAR